MLEIILIDSVENQHIEINVKRKRDESDIDFIERGIKKQWGAKYGFMPNIGMGGSKHGTLVYEMKNGVKNCLKQIKAITE